MADRKFGFETLCLHAARFPIPRPHLDDLLGSEVLGNQIQRNRLIELRVLLRSIAIALGVAVLAALADFGAAGDRIPGSFGPFDLL